MRKVNIEVFVTVGSLLQLHRNSGGLVFFLTVSHCIGAGNVTVICYTAVFIHLHEEVVVDSLQLVAFANITSEYAGIEVRSRLIGVVSTSVQVIEIEAKCQPFVYIDRKIRFESLFTVYLITRFIISQICIRNITVGEEYLIGTNKETGEWRHKNSRFGAFTIKEYT